MSGPDAAYVALALTPGIGAARLSALLARFDTAQATISASPKDLREVPGISPAAMTAIRRAKVAHAERIIARAADQGGRPLTPDDPDFPPALRVIPEPPTLLFAAGKTSLAGSLGLAVVGSRSHTRYGAEICRHLAGGAARAGITIVSGMARGIDGLAHKAALDAGGGTIGVLGNGLGVIYPSANRALYERVREHGLMITEFPPGERPHAGSFQRRNRLISGLARATLVVEAREKSGALITVDCALAQGREVMVVPGPITSPTSVGCNRLIQSGAKPVLGLRDVLEEFNLEFSEPNSATLPPDLLPTERRVLKLLECDTQHADHVASSLALSTPETLAVLTNLELRGLIEALPGKVFRRRATCACTDYRKRPSAIPMHVYVHVPFCARRCSYCDFAIAVRRIVPGRRFVDAVRLEYERRREVEGWDPTVWSTVYLGGGTPSRLQPDDLRRLLDAFPRPADAEVTLEANPEDVSTETARVWNAAGVTRVSLGAQSFDDAVLTWMHRTHNAAAIGAAVARLRDAGIADVSLDLIFALPEELQHDPRRDLDAAVALEPQHLSAYGLTREGGTPYARWTERGAATPAPEDRYEAEFLLVHELLSAAGYEHYEISNFAKPGHRAQHNSAYWSGRSYLGLGPSAHSLRAEERRWNVPHWAAYERTVTAGADPVAGLERLTEAQRDLERVYLALRTKDGLSATEADRLAPGPRTAAERAGWLEAHGNRLTPTPAGWLVLDELVTVLSP